MSGFPILRIHATGPAPNEIDEISLDGVPLEAISCVLSIGADRLTTAVITLHVTPDIDTPVEMPPGESSCSCPEPHGPGVAHMQGPGYDFYTAVAP